MPTRFVTLMNPRPRRRTRRMGLRNRLGRFVRRRMTHANPSSRRVRRVRRHRRVHHMNPPKMTVAMRRKVSAGVRRYYATRRSHPSAVAVRRPFIRRMARRSSGGLRAGSITGAFKSALSKPMLMKAGGAVAASFGTGYIMNRWGSSLPLANNQYGKLIYILGIPVAAAYLLRNKNRDLAEGLVIGGLVMSINSLMQSFRVGLPAAPAAAAATVGAYSVAGELTGRRFAAYPQAMSSPAMALGGSNAAFPQSAW